MKRSGYIRRKPPNRKGADPVYTAWVHTRPCVGLRAFPSEFDPQGMEEVCGHACAGWPHGATVEQSHIRNHTGLGLKPPDRRSLPMCPPLHRMWEQRTGWFAGWSQLARIEWADKYIAEENAAFDLERASAA